MAFTSDLSGQEFWLVVDKGYLPLGLVLGNSVYSMGAMGGWLAGLKGQFRGEVTEITRLTHYADAQERKVSELQRTVLQLEWALESRVVIERAIGMLSERFVLAIPDAFELLRSGARNSRREVRAIAEEITESRGWTPGEITDALRRREP